MHIDLLVQLPGEPSILAQVDLQTQGSRLTGLNVGTGGSAETPNKYSML